MTERASRRRGGAAGLLLLLPLTGVVFSGCSKPPPLPPPVRVGLDRVAAGEIPELDGKRLGLVTNNAAVTLDGRSAVEVFGAPPFDLRILFAPEHGLDSAWAAGQPVPNALRSDSGLPVRSIYGRQVRPSPQDLAEIDALVFDLQDAGVRFYTYASSLLLTLEAAAAADLPLFVLDRPNPLGGDYVAGPYAAPRTEVTESLVNLLPGPLVHGLTLGELARLHNRTLVRPARLRVVTMEGWRRGMWFEHTGRPWRAPSPNLRTPEAALAYPGTALLEATNVSEGRGTEAPFLLLGAPWLDAEALVRALAVPGFTLHVVSFVPAASPAAPTPKYQGERCSGVRVEVTGHPDGLDPYRFGLELLAALARQPGFAWRDEGAALTRLLGTPAVGDALRMGRPALELLLADRAAHARWREERQAAIIY